MREMGAALQIIPRRRPDNRLMGCPVHDCTFLYWNWDEYLEGRSVIRSAPYPNQKIVGQHRQITAFLLMMVPFSLLCISVIASLELPDSLAGVIAAFALTALVMAVMTLFTYITALVKRQIVRYLLRDMSLVCSVEVSDDLPVNGIFIANVQCGLLWVAPTEHDALLYKLSHPVVPNPYLGI